LKILVVFPYFLGPDSTGSSGVKNMVLSHMRASTDEDIEFTVVTPAPGPFDVEFEDAGAKVLHAGFEKHLVIRRNKNPFYILFSYQFFLLQNVLRFMEIIRREKPDIVHTHSSAFLGAAIAARFKGVPSIIHVHEFLNYLPENLYTLYNRIVLAFCDRLVIISNILEGYFSFGPHSTEKLRLVYNGMDPDKFGKAARDNQFRKSAGINEGAPVIGCLGRIAPKKGVDLIIRAMPQVWETVPEAVFLVVGGPDEPEDFPYYEKIKRMADEIDNSGRIVFSGHVNDPSDALGSFDVLVLASHTDTAPMAVLEAMSMKLPVVSASHGGAEDMVKDKVTGLRVDPGDIDGIAQAVTTLLVNETLRAEMGRAGRRCLEEVFSQGKMAESINDIYRELTGN